MSSKQAKRLAPTSARSTEASAQVRTLADDIAEQLTHALARDPDAATPRDLYLALSGAVWNRLAERWTATQKAYRDPGTKRVYYLSLEFLMGRTLGNALINLGLEGDAAEALHEIGYRLEDLREQEPDAGLGNGGLGRLAACFLDSMASQQIAGYGYGIRYEHGIFKQRIVDGRQVEMPDSWLLNGNPWEIARPERTFRVKFYGRVEGRIGPDQRVRYAWVDTSDVLAMAHDTPVPGYSNGVVNTLRLWAAKATEDFALSDFIRGDYVSAVEAKIHSETISKMLYPPDDTGQGKELRLKQQYFFVAATLQDIIRRHLQDHDDIRSLPEHAQIQLNDTHPAVAIPDLMRILLDEHDLEWDQAWDITTRTCAYTNHTVLPEALECWDEGQFGHLLPRHLDLIREIDRRFRIELTAKTGFDLARIEKMAIISGGRIRMAHLAIVGSHTVNGVAELHTQILKDRVFHDFHEIYPTRIVAVTNGVTQRRWMLKANPGLSSLITETIGDGWVRDLDQLSGLEAFAHDSEFRQRWRQAKDANKRSLAQLLVAEANVIADPRTLFDVQVKRIHEYKRQLMAALYAAYRYAQLKTGQMQDAPGRTMIFAGKAAPTYWAAKNVIHLIHAIGRRINTDPETSSRFRIAYLPDYRVSMAEKIFAGADLSEQISTAGLEASGTGNMKFALNGALTIGTLDGANVEIAEAVGDMNIFIFGLTADQVAQKLAAGYDPSAHLGGRLRTAFSFLESNAFGEEERRLFRPIIQALFRSDPYLVVADFEAYCFMQEEVDLLYQDPEEWSYRSILNVARCGRFSSDRSIRDYAQKVWNL